MPFEHTYKRTEHYDKHCLKRGEFPGLTEPDYETQADIFLTRKRKLTMIQCRRPQGDIIRLDLITKEFGVLGSNGFVITYFVARPANHAYYSNVCYFRAECKRIFKRP